jgi:hypothetical protein
MIIKTLWLLLLIILFSGCTIQISDFNNDLNSLETNNSDLNENINLTDNINEFICNPDWNCYPWQDCINNLQIRICEDSNKCNTEKEKPTESQYCESVIEPSLEKINDSYYIINNGDLNISVIGTMIRESEQHQRIGLCITIENNFENDISVQLGCVTPMDGLAPGTCFGFTLLPDDTEYFPFIFNTVKSKSKVSGCAFSPPEQTLDQYEATLINFEIIVSGYTLNFEKNI